MSNLGKNKVRAKQLAIMMRIDILCATIEIETAAGLPNSSLDFPNIFKLAFIRLAFAT